MAAGAKLHVEPLDGREVYKNLPPHAQEEFGEIVDSRSNGGTDLSESVKAASDAVKDRYSIHYVAASLDLLRPEAGDKQLSDLRAFRATGPRTTLASKSSSRSFAALRLRTNPIPSHSQTTSVI